MVIAWWGGKIVQKFVSPLPLNDPVWVVIPSLPPSLVPPHTPPPYPPPYTPEDRKRGGAITRPRKEAELLPSSESLPPDVAQFVKAWNGYFSLTRINVLGKRIKLIQDAFLNPYWQDNWREGLKKLVSTPFVMGKNKHGWKANLEWFLNSENVDKLLAGTYDGIGPKKIPTDYGRDQI